MARGKKEDMPELVEHDVTVADVRAGDVVVQHDHEDLVPTNVANVTHKQSWSYIYVEHVTEALTGTKPLRWRSDGHVRVQRSQATADERAASLRALTIDA